MGNYLGDFNTSARVDDSFTMVSADGTPTAVTSGSVVCRRSGQTTLAPAGVTAITTSGGLHTFAIFTGSASTYFLTGFDYHSYLGNGTITTTSVIGYMIHTFSINNRGGQINWANTTGTATLNSNTQNIKGTGAIGTAGYVAIDWAATTGSATLNANVQNVKGTGITAAAGFVGVDWAITTGTATLNANVQNVKGTGINALIAGRIDSNAQVIANAAIASATFAASAVDAAALATDAANEIADAFLARDIAGGSSTSDRDVTSALKALRNKTVITTTGQLIVYEADDLTTAWTAVTTTATAVSITSVDPT